MRAWLVMLLLASCTPKLGATEEQPLKWSLEGSLEKQRALAYLDVLLDSSVPLAVGQHCSFGNVPPVGRSALEGLVGMERSDLLLRALEAPSAEGRIYAAIGLARLGQISWDEVSARAAREPIVNVCGGCITLQVSGVEALNYDLERETRLDL